MNVLALALSRSRELDADIGAVSLIGDPLLLASALQKIEARSRTSVWMRWMQLGTPSWALTHPPTSERVRRLFALARRSEVLQEQSVAKDTPQERVIVPEWRRPTSPRSYVRLEYSR